MPDYGLATEKKSHEKITPRKNRPHARCGDLKCPICGRRRQINVHINVAQVAG
jgi:hypothetical protein